jgi:cell division protein FtsA
VALRTGVTEAERVKKKHGCALVSLVPEEDMIEVQSVGTKKARIMGRQLLAEVLQARTEEVCQLVLAEIRKSGFDQSLNGGIVLTGGGAMLEGMVEIGEQIFDLPVRLGTPSGITGLVDVVSSPAHATAVGLVLRSHRARLGEGRLLQEMRATGTFGRLTGRIRDMFSGLF